MGFEILWTADKEKEFDPFNFARELLKDAIENLKKDDKVVTIAGIHGKINKVNEDGTLSLEINPGSYLKIEKSSISLEWTNQLNKAAAASEKK